MFSSLASFWRLRIWTWAALNSTSERHIPFNDHSHIARALYYHDYGIRRRKCPRSGRLPFLPYDYDDLDPFSRLTKLSAMQKVIYFTAEQKRKTWKNIKTSLYQIKISLYICQNVFILSGFKNIACTFEQIRELENNMNCLVSIMVISGYVTPHAFGRL